MMSPTLLSLQASSSFSISICRPVLECAIKCQCVCRGHRRLEATESPRSAAVFHLQNPNIIVPHDRESVCHHPTNSQHFRLPRPTVSHVAVTNQSGCLYSPQLPSGWVSRKTDCYIDEAPALVRRDPVAPSRKSLEKRWARLLLLLQIYENRPIPIAHFLHQFHVPTPVVHVILDRPTLPFHLRPEALHRES